MASLNVVDGPARGQRFTLSRRTVMVGRDTSCAIAIADERISRRHLQVTFEPQGHRHVAMDVGSSNGVTVNGVRLVRGVARALDDGDEIGIGATALRYSSDEA